MFRYGFIPLILIYGVFLIVAHPTGGAPIPTKILVRVVSKDAR